MDAKVGKNFLRIGQDIHQMADWGTLISCDIAHAIFQKSLCNCQNPFTTKGFACADFEMFDFFYKGPFRHSLSGSRLPALNKASFEDKI